MPAVLGATLLVVPEGDPEEIRACAQVLIGTSGQLAGVASELGSMPGMLSSWQGRASVSYAGSALTNGKALSAGEVALARAGQVLRSYADELEDAQRKVRRAIEHVDEAQRAIEAAETALGEAAGERTDASTRAGAAELEITLTGLAGAPSAGAMDERRRAQADEQAAADREASARRKLEAAQTDRRAAEKQGLAGEQAAADAARVAAGALRSLSYSPAAAYAGQVQAARARAQTEARERAEAEADEGSVFGDIVHGGLDVVGMVPFVGEPADLLNGGIYAAEGDELNAGLSFAGAVPGLGWGATGTKWGMKYGDDVVEGADTANDARRAVPPGGAGRIPYAADPSKTPDWLRRVWAGNDFNKARRPHYENNEVYVRRPDGKGYRVLDSYNPLKEIVSRKHTQLGEVTEQTAIKDLRELSNKYPPGTPIADVPSTSPRLKGKNLEGDMFLEVPVQTTPIPKSVLEEANRLDIQIRDVDGRVYNSSGR